MFVSMDPNKVIARDEDIAVMFVPASYKSCQFVEAEQKVNTNIAW